jgi:hypothetical protein
MCVFCICSVTGLLLGDDTKDYERVWGGKGNASPDILNQASSSISSTLGIDENTQTGESKQSSTTAKGEGVSSTQRKPQKDEHKEEEEEEEEDTEEMPDTVPEVKSSRGWFRKMIPYGEIYSLEWEPKVLQQLGDDVSRFLHKFVAGKVRNQILKYTVMNTLMAAW